VSRQARVGPGGERAVPVQRLAAYAVVVLDGSVLLTRLSAITEAPGLWVLPGGGVEHGESPLDAVAREVHEETGHRLRDVRLLDVGSQRIVGRSPRGRLEDFHTVQVVYTAGVQQVRRPEVLDVGGSTDLAAWVPLPELADLRISESTRNWLARTT
jgi:8-oxo-dGTP diphosphatase